MMNLLASLNGRLASNDIPSEIIPIVAIVFTFVWLIIKTLVSPFVAAKANKNAAKAGGNASPSADEALLIRQMQQTLTKMEERVEALETILLEQSRSQKL